MYLLQKYFLGCAFLSFPDNMILLVDIWNWYVFKFTFEMRSIMFYTFCSIVSKQNTYVHILGLNTWCHSNSVSFKSHSISVTFKFCAVRVALSALEPRSTDSLGTQHQNLKVTLIEWHQVFTPLVCSFSSFYSRLCQNRR